MIQIDVTVIYNGKGYITNVITHRNTSDEEILRLAYEQVQKQWFN